jgi:hypothetical protein
MPEDRKASVRPPVAPGNVQFQSKPGGRTDREAAAVE